MPTRYLLALAVLTSTAIAGEAPITLREYVDVRIAAQQQAVEAALASASLAVAKAEAASDKRFDSVNEFRAQLDDQTRTLMPRLEVEAQLSTLKEKVDANAATIKAISDRGAGMNQGWVVLVSVLAVVTSIGGLLLALLRNRKAST
jgi:hypothetical protein